jgi:hypothetical protein
MRHEPISPERSVIVMAAKMSLDHLAQITEESCQG